MKTKKIILAVAFFAVLALLACGNDSSTTDAAEKTFVPSADDQVTCKIENIANGFKMQITFAGIESYVIESERYAAECHFNAIIGNAYGDAANGNAPSCNYLNYERFVKAYEEECKAVDGKKRSDYDAYEDKMQNAITCDVVDSTESHYLQRRTEFGAVVETELVVEGDSVLKKVTSPFVDGKKHAACTDEKTRFPGLKYECDDENIYVTQVSKVSEKDKGKVTLSEIMANAASIESATCKLGYKSVK